MSEMELKTSRERSFQMRVENLKQTRFGKWPVTRRAPKPAAVRSAKEGYAAANKMAADIVLSEVERYGGEQAGLVQWARLVQAKMAPMDSECGPLFRQAA